MNHVYCQHCYKKTPQTTDLVKFCAHCGKPFIETNANTKPQSKPEVNNSSRSKSTLSQEDEQTLIRLKRLAAFKKAELEATIDEDDETEVDDPDFDDDSDINLPTTEELRVPKINKLKVDVDIDNDKGVPVRALAKNAKRQPKQEKVRKKFDKKKFLEQYSKEASAIKPK